VLEQGEKISIAVRQNYKNIEEKNTTQLRRELIEISYIYQSSPLKQLYFSSKRSTKPFFKKHAKHIHITRAMKATSHKSAVTKNSDPMHNFLPVISWRSSETNSTWSGSRDQDYLMALQNAARLHKIYTCHDYSTALIRQAHVTHGFPLRQCGPTTGLDRIFKARELSQYYLLCVLQ